jgi:signal transduction histidine kinase
MNELYNDKIVKKRTITIALLNISVVIIVILMDFISTYNEFNWLNEYKQVISKVLLITIITINCVIGYILFSYINKKLTTISNNITSAMNGNYNVNENLLPEYEEGIIYSIEYQIKMLISKLYINNQQVIKDKKKLNTLVTEVSHQIKTPVAAVKLFHQLLENNDIDIEQKKKILSKMEEEINRIQWFVQSLTDISKLETGLIHLNIEENNINDTIIQAVNTVYLSANNKNIDITMNGEINNNIKYDKKWTKEAIVNILDNAIKYTDSEGDIMIELVSTPMNNKIRITDTGKGIDKKELPFIFDRFYKSYKTGVDEGIGVGLYLAKEIMRNQNGTIKVYSKLHKGTTFELIFYRE